MLLNEERTGNDFEIESIHRVAYSAVFFLCNFFEKRATTIKDTPIESLWKMYYNDIKYISASDTCWSQPLSMFLNKERAGAITVYLAQCCVDRLPFQSSQLKHFILTW